MVFIKESITVSYKNRVLQIPMLAVILCCTFVFLAFLTFCIALLGQSSIENEHLKQELIIQKTVNESLTIQINKSNNKIEKLVENLSDNDIPHKQKYQELKTISSLTQVYDIFKGMENNLKILDRLLSIKSNRVNKVINITKINNTSLTMKGLHYLNMSDSINIGRSVPSIEKASGKVNILASINIDGMLDKLHLKKTGFDVLSSMLIKLPINKPVKNGRFVSGFGHRFHPIHHRYKMHNGIDFVGPKNAKVISTGEGVIEKALYSTSYGNFVVIRHKGNIKTLYAHMKSLKVKRGQKVKTGDVIGVQGSTGLSTGDHIHYEILVENQHKDPLNFIRVKSILSNGY